MGKGYDSKCYDLAEHFLHKGEGEDLKQDLAQTIQDAVEDWFESEEQAIDADIIRRAVKP